MFTDCPNCLRQFRLGAAHLSAAAGEVRCGFCGTQFNALSRLRDTPLPRTPPPGNADVADVMIATPAADEPEFDIALHDEAVEPAPPVRVTAPRPAPAMMFAPEEEIPRRTRLWAAIGLLLVVAGAAEVTWFERDRLMARFPALRPHVELLCSRIGCSVMRERDLSAITVLNRDVRFHPRYRDALLVNATLSNSAPAAQPFPRIQLALSDTSGRIVAARAFTPEEYLDGSIDKQRGMAPGAPVHVVLEIAGVTPEAASFEIGFR